MNLGCLGLHVWPYLAADPEHADELRIDVDPSPGVTFDMVQEAAGEVRELLDELGMDGAPKTTGRNGIHIYVRLLPEQDSFAVRAAAVALARELERRRPDLITAAWWKEERGDARLHRLQPERAAQDRARRVERPAPRRRRRSRRRSRWDELEAIVPDELTLATVPARPRPAAIRGRR